MATAVQNRRGTAAQHDDGTGFTGLEGELTVDTTNDTVRVHDGSTKGGHRLAKLSEAQGSTTLSALTDTTITSPASGHILIHDGSDSFDNKAISGAITINVNGVTTLASGQALSNLGGGSGSTFLRKDGIFATPTDTNTEYTGGTGLTLDGTTFNVDAAQTQITSVGALDTGSITSGFGSINNGTNSITTTGNLYAGSTTLGATTVDANLTVQSTTADSDFKPEILLKRNGGVNAGDDGDVLGALVFEGDNFAGTQKVYARIGVAIKDDGTGVANGQVKGEIKFACAAGDDGAPDYETPSARIDHQGIHTNENVIDGNGNKNFFHTHNCGSGGGLKFHSNDGNHTTTIKAKNPSADQEITIPNVTGDIVLAVIAGGSINGGGGTGSAKTAWSVSDFVANPNSTYIHYNAVNGDDLTVGMPFIGVDAVTVGTTFKFVNASPQAGSTIILDLDAFTHSGTQYYALIKLDGGTNSTILSNASNLVVSVGGQVTLTAAAAGVWLVDGIGYA